MRPDPRAPAEPSRLYAGTTALLTWSLVLVPIANALAAPRRSQTLPLGSVDPVVTSLLVATAAATLFLGLRLRRTGVASPVIWWLLALLAWLAVRYLAEEDLESTRNVVTIGLVLVALVGAGLRGVDVLAHARRAFRAAAIVSCVLFVVAPTWFINASEYFQGTGKIFSDLPNAQGVLSHPNFTGLYFATAIILELHGVITRRSPIGVVFLCAHGGLLLITQTRSAVIGAAIAAAVMLSHRIGRRRLTRVLLGVIAAVATLPAVMIVWSWVAGVRPDFSTLAWLGTREDLWIGVAEVLPEAPFVGSGEEGIRQARRFVTDADVLFVTHAHNEVLTLWLSGGLVAVALYLGFVVVGIDRADRAVSGLRAGMMALLLFTSLSESPLTAFLPQAGTVLVCLLAADSIESRANRERRWPGVDRWSDTYRRAARRLR